MDNVAVDGYFDIMGGDLSASLIDHYSPPETKLFQTVVLQELLNKEETPQEFICWLHTNRAKKLCSLADLNPGFLEMAALKLQDKWHEMPRKRLLQVLNAVTGHHPT